MNKAVLVMIPEKEYKRLLVVKGKGTWLEMLQSVKKTNKK